MSLDVASYGSVMRSFMTKQTKLSSVASYSQSGKNTSSYERKGGSGVTRESWVTRSAESRSAPRRKGRRFVPGARFKSRGL